MTAELLEMARQWAQRGKHRAWRGHDVPTDHKNVEEYKSDRVIRNIKGTLEAKYISDGTGRPQPTTERNRHNIFWNTSPNGTGSKQKGKIGTNDGSTTTLLSQKKKERRKIGQEYLFIEQYMTQHRNKTEHTTMMEQRMAQVESHHAVYQGPH